MNYINKLESERNELARDINRTDYAIQEFKEYLMSDKFIGFDIDGDRKDWISTADVLARMELIRKELLGLNN
jgi:hypothetical protein